MKYAQHLKKCQLCSKLAIKSPERGQCRRSGVFIVNFGHISHLFSVSFVSFSVYFCIAIFSFQHFIPWLCVL